MQNEIVFHTDLCDGCGICVQTCPQLVFTSTGKHSVPKISAPERCYGCLACEEDCPQRALTVHRLPEGMTSASVPEPGAGLDENEVYDIVIVGAGPAGLGAALRARKLGMSAAVIERLPSPDRIHHPDGGVIFSSPAIYDLKAHGTDLYIEPLDLLISGEVIEERLHDFFLVGPSGQRTLPGIGKGPGFAVVNKAAMLKSFACAARDRGAIIAYNTRAHSITPRDSQGLRRVIIDGGRAVTGRVVLSAEGITGHLVHDAGVPVNQKPVGWSIAPFVNLAPLTLPTVAAGFSISDGPGANGARMSYLGYSSSGPHATHVAYGPIQSRKSRIPDKPATEILSQYMRESTLLRDQLSGQVPATTTEFDGCRVFVRRLPDKMSSDGLMAVGDSIATCGMITTMLALKTGDLAAQTAHRAIRKNNTSAAALAEYDRTVRRIPMFPAMSWMSKLLIEAPLQLDRRDQDRLFDKLQRLAFGRVQSGHLWPLVRFYAGILPTLLTNRKMRSYLVP